MFVDFETITDGIISIHPMQITAVLDREKNFKSMKAGITPDERSIIEKRLINGTGSFSTIFTATGQSFNVFGERKNICEHIVKATIMVQRMSMSSSLDIMEKLGKKMAKDAETEIPGNEWKQGYEENEDDEEDEDEKI